ncbi:hypothetical protein JS531_00875 [Bifidobacterium sp. CP2]|uniref:hypothetical protein n=1 Tax=Bifidobacterium TaxID=1678 RepID=UPI001BDD1E5D|nr:MULTISPECIES: hypothetical protein [Bifidobacterium]MBT1180551.1 hypothetical protein [Bifidobacterium sp. CP2]MBW3080392.1 hypothetical protein [Bifidobacterium saguinibicoloris]
MTDIDEKTLDDKLAAAQTIDEVMAIAEEAGHPLSYEEADAFFGRIEQAKSDTAELIGDSVKSEAEKEFGI